MLNKKNRIQNRHTIEKLFKEGKLYKTPFFIFKYSFKNTPPSQFAVSVSKKFSKKATQRNRLKRQIYEAIRPKLDQLAISLKVLIIARPHLAEKKLDFHEIDAVVDQFFNTIQSHV